MAGYLSTQVCMGETCSYELSSVVFSEKTTCLLINE